MLLVPEHNRDHIGIEKEQAPPRGGSAGGAAAGASRPLAIGSRPRRRCSRRARNRVVGLA